MLENIQETNQENNNQKTNKLASIAGKILIAYASINIIYNFICILNGTIDFYLPREIYYILLFILSIFLLSKNKNNKIITILICILSSVDILNIISVIYNNITMYGNYNVIDTIYSAISIIIGNLNYIITSIFLVVTALIFNKNQTNKKIWLIPIIIEIIYYLKDLIINFYYFIIYGYNIEFIYFITTPIYIFGITYLLMYLTYDTKLNNNFNLNKEEYGNIYYDLGMHVVLLLFLGIIWNYIWIYRVTKYLNQTPNEEYRNPKNKVLLCIFVPFYQIYWIYHSAKRIDIMAQNKNISSDIATMSLILAIFIPIIPLIIMQSKLNKITTTNEVQNNNVYNDNFKTQPPIDITNEIRKYKQLLDEGIISQEEFEAKKKQLLDM